VTHPLSSPRAACVHLTRTKATVLTRRAGACAVGMALAIASSTERLEAQTQNADSVVRVLRGRYERMLDNQARYTDYETALDSLGLERWPIGHGRIAAAFDGDTLRTVTASYASDRGHVTESFYFWRGAPFEVRVHFSNTTDHSGAPRGPAEQRFYFNRGYLVRWIDPHRTIRPLTTGAVFARAMQLMADGTRLVDAAHRLRDHTLVPATPADVADLMRRELQSLTVAELSYYSEFARYSSDIRTTGYEPRSRVVHVELVSANDRGWAARATAPTLPGKSCVVYLGRPKKLPKTESEHVQPSDDRAVACDRP